MKPSELPPRRAIDWLEAGWQVFMRAPGLWMGMTLLVGVSAVVVQWLPFLGALLVCVAAPAVFAGLLIGCQSLAEGQPLRIEHLVAGLERFAVELLLLGALYTLGVLAVIGVTALAGGAGLASLVMANHGLAGLTFGSVFFVGLIHVLLMLLLFAAIWLAPALVVFDRLAPLAALQASFRLSMRNKGAVGCFGLVVYALSLLAAMPAGLGFLVLMPVVVGATRAAWRDLSGVL